MRDALLMDDAGRVCIVQLTLTLPRNFNAFQEPQL